MGTITKALDLLNLFSCEQPEIALSQFKKTTGQDKATVYRHLSELQANGFLEQNPATKAYRLGPALLRLAAMREQTYPLRKVVAPWVDELSRRLSELVHVSVLQNDHMCPIYHSNLHSHGTRVHIDETEKLPLHATSSGVSMLAFGPDGLMAQTLARPLDAFTPKTITSAGKLEGEVLRTRRRGYSYTDQGFESEVCSLAMPIFDAELRAFGTLAVAVPSSRMNRAMKENIVKELISSSSAVSQALGGAVPLEIEELWKKAA